MKTNIKRIFSVFMAMAVLFSLCINAYATATPEATIDYSRKGSLSFYKYDMTAAGEAGVWNTESYVSTGLQNSDTA